MAKETKLEKLDPVPAVLEAEPVSKLGKHDAASGTDGIPSDSCLSISSSENATSGTKGEGFTPLSAKSQGDAASSIKGDIEQQTVGEHSVYVPPTSSYNYYYPGELSFAGFGGSFSQLDDHGYFQPDGSQTGIQSDNGSMVYYLPGYGPYGSGPVVGVDGQNVTQQPYFSSGYLQHPVSYGSEAVPCYSWDSNYLGDVPNGDAGFENGKSGSRSTAFAKSNGLNSTKSNGQNGSKFSKPTYTQPIGSLSKVSPLGTDFSAGLLNGYRPVGKFSSFTGQKQGPSPQIGTMNYRQNERMWNGNHRNKSRDGFNNNVDFETSTELTRGPRALKKNAPLDSLVKKEDLGFTVRREQYNLQDFVTEYANAKFYVIKSYNEDDIHKSIKYDVWSSTLNGNKRLDAAFHYAEEVSKQTGTKCPIFLFFSVNASGQFVGLAEMVGQVDFNKDMDFWQLDKWSGFFPVKWHVVKDIPNNQLRHIVLENNDGNSVTFSRDTQEIGLKQGLEMLNIFKSYSAKSSLLDDFNFYENREKSNLTKKSNKTATLRMETFENGDFPKQTKAEEKKFGNYSSATRTTNPSSLINPTKNLSLNSYSPKSNSVKKLMGNSIPAVPPP